MGAPSCSSLFLTEIAAHQLDGALNPRLNAQCGRQSRGLHQQEVLPSLVPSQPGRCHRFFFFEPRTMPNVACGSRNERFFDFLGSTFPFWIQCQQKNNEGYGIHSQLLIMFLRISIINNVSSISHPNETFESVSKDPSIAASCRRSCGRRSLPMPQRSGSKMIWRRHR